MKVIHISGFVTVHLDPRAQCQALTLWLFHGNRLALALSDQVLVRLPGK
jgi:hypothetical protein